MLKIEKGIPLPKARMSGLTATLRAMKSGDSITLPLEKRPAIYAVARAAGVNVSTSKMDAATLRVWRL